MTLYALYIDRKFAKDVRQFEEKPQMPDGYAYYEIIEKLDVPYDPMTERQEPLIIDDHEAQTRTVTARNVQKTPSEILSIQEPMLDFFYEIDAKARSANGEPPISRDEFLQSLINRVSPRKE